MKSRKAACGVEQTGKYGVWIVLYEDHKRSNPSRGEAEACAHRLYLPVSADSLLSDIDVQVESQGRLLKCKKTEVVAVKGGNDPPYQLRFAYVSQRGYYPDDLEKENQDSFAVHPNFDNNTNVHMFGVFDGHGQNGTPCSHYARDNVPEQIKKRMKNPKMVRCKLAQRVAVQPTMLPQDFTDAYAGAFPCTA